jgi:hypothetical protein
MSGGYNKLIGFIFSSHVTHTFQQSVSLENTLEIDRVIN